MKTGRQLRRREKASMNDTIHSHNREPIPSPSATPKRGRSTCVIVLGVALVSAVLVAGALALLLGSDLMASVHHIRGMAYYEQGELDRAVTAFDRAIELKPDYASAFFNRGLAYSAMGDYDRAIADFTQAITLNPGFAGAHHYGSLA